MPLKVYCKDLNKIVLWKDFDKIPKEYKYVCPHCQESMIPVNAIEKIKHWRHYKLCMYQTEPETDEHINMKAWCFDNIPINNDDIELIDVEHRFKEIKRIADIYIRTKDGNEIVIECQASTIPYDEFMKRCEDYSNVHLMWIWSSSLANRMKKHKKYLKDINDKKIYIHFPQDITKHVHGEVYCEHMKYRSGFDCIFSTRWRAKHIHEHIIKACKLCQSKNGKPFIRIETMDNLVFYLWKDIGYLSQSLKKFDSVRIGYSIHNGYRNVVSLDLKKYDFESTDITKVLPKIELSQTNNKLLNFKMAS